MHFSHIPRYGGSCKHDMVRPWDADGGDGFQIWRVAGNILNMQPRTADKELSPAWRLGEGLPTPHRRKPAC
jgi:hypothetical protein